MPLPDSATFLSIIDGMAIVLGQAYQLTRIRIASADSPILRLTAERDNAIREAELLRRELDIVRTSRQGVAPHRRPEYGPAERMAIIQLMRLRGWNLKTTAQRFVIHENTLRDWIKAVEGKRRTSLLDGGVIWNKADDAVRWVVHELRRLFPEKEFGTRTIARHLLRAGIKLSRSTVQRVLREPEIKKPPRRPRPVMEKPVGVESHGLLKPKRLNHVWHSDITQIRIMWFTFFVTAILDGFSRKILALKVYARTPCDRNMAVLVKRAAARHGSPKFIITDNGSQFRKQFGKAMRRQRIRHVRTRVRTPFVNGKIERFFRSFKLWARLVLFGWNIRSIQHRLDNFADWYNIHRPHSAVGVHTPQETFAGRKLPEPAVYRARDRPNIQIQIHRRCFRGDPHLPVVDITVRKAA